MIGPNNAVTGIRLTFNQPLDPATAQDVDAYVILRKINVKGSDDGGLFDSFVPFSDSSTGNSTKVKKLRFDSAVYDPATMSVTITPHKTFTGDKYFRQIRVAGQGDHAIRNTDGVPLDGNGDGKPGDNALLKFHDRRGKHLNFKEVDGDRVSIKLSGPGKIVSMTRRKGQPAPLLFIVGGVPGKTVLSGTIKQGRNGDGMAEIQEISGVSTATVTLADNPAFHIDFTQL